MALWSEASKSILDFHLCLVCIFANNENSLLLKLISLRDKLCFMFAAHSTLLAMTVPADTIYLSFCK